MNISSAQGFLQFLTNVKNNRGDLDVQSLIEELKSKRPNLSRGRKGGRGNSEGQVEGASNDESTDVAQASETNNESTENVSPDPSSTSAPASSNELSELASLYVKQYEEGAGVTLSEEAFEQKKAEVVDLYSRLGTERLDDIVFSNDVDQTA